MIMNAQGKKVLLILVGTIWISGLGFGFSKLYNYEYKTAVLKHVTKQWPSESFVHPSSDLYTLVMVAHPKCPCTRASIGELALIMAKAQGKLHAYVLFIKPKGMDETWVKSDLFKAASEIPGVEVIIDDEGKQAQIFGGNVSGQTLVYNRKGQLVFAGGITDSRGHSGDNIGRSSIEDIVHDRLVSVHSTPTFGCLLKSPKGADDAIKE